VSGYNKSTHTALATFYESTGATKAEGLSAMFLFGGDAPDLR
jgi:hypothetical protein